MLYPLLQESLTTTILVAVWTSTQLACRLLQQLFPGYIPAKVTILLSPLLDVLPSFVPNHWICSNPLVALQRHRRRQCKSLQRHFWFGPLSSTSTSSEYNIFVGSSLLYVHNMSVATFFCQAHLEEWDTQDTLLAGYAWASSLFCQKVADYVLWTTPYLRCYSQCTDLRCHENLYTSYSILCNMFDCTA